MTNVLKENYDNSLCVDWIINSAIYFVILLISNACEKERYLIATGFISINSYKSDGKALETLGLAFCLVNQWFRFERTSRNVFHIFLQ